MDILHAQRPDLMVDGEMMADTAVTPELVDEFYPFSLVRDANVLIFPNLEAANIAYKLVKCLGQVESIGPILLGMDQSIHVLQRGEEVRGVVNIAAMAVIDAQAKGRGLKE